MHSRRERLARQVVKKETIEDIFKSLAWIIISGTLMRFAYIKSSDHEFWVALGLWLASTVFFSLATIYVAIHVALPIAKSVDPPYGYPEDSLIGLSGFRYMLEKSKIAITRPAVIYMTIAMAYFVFESPRVLRRPIGLSQAAIAA